MYLYSCCLCICIYICICICICISHSCSFNHQNSMQKTGSHVSVWFTFGWHCLLFLLFWCHVIYFGVCFRCPVLYRLQYLISCCRASQNLCVFFFLNIGNWQLLFDFCFYCLWDLLLIRDYFIFQSKPQPKTGCCCYINVTFAHIAVVSF